MKNFMQNDKKNRKIIKNLEKKRLILKNLVKNLFYSNFIRWLAILNLNELSKKSSKIILVNKCILTANKKRFRKFYNYSRIIFVKIFNQ